MRQAQPAVGLVDLVVAGEGLPHLGAEPFQRRDQRLQRPVLLLGGEAVGVREIERLGREACRAPRRPATPPLRQRAMAASRPERGLVSSGIEMSAQRASAGVMEACASTMASAEAAASCRPSAMMRSWPSASPATSLARASANTTEPISTSLPARRAASATRLAVGSMVVASVAATVMRRPASRLPPPPWAGRPAGSARRTAGPRRRRRGPPVEQVHSTSPAPSVASSKGPAGARPDLVREPARVDGIVEQAPPAPRGAAGTPGSISARSSSNRSARGATVCTMTRFTAHRPLLRGRAPSLT